MAEPPEIGQIGRETATLPARVIATRCAGVAACLQVAVEAGEVAVSSQLYHRPTGQICRESATLSAGVVATGCAGIATSLIDADGSGDDLGWLLCDQSSQSLSINLPLQLPEELFGTERKRVQKLRILFSSGEEFGKLLLVHVGASGYSA